MTDVPKRFPTRRCGAYNAVSNTNFFEHDSNRQFQALGLTVDTLGSHMNPKRHETLGARPYRTLQSLPVYHNLSSIDMPIICTFKTPILACPRWQETQLTRLKQIMSSKLGFDFQEWERRDISLTVGYRAEGGTSNHLNPRTIPTRSRGSHEPLSPRF